MVAWLLILCIRQGRRQEFLSRDRKIQVGLRDGGTSPTTPTMDLHDRHRCHRSTLGEVLDPSIPHPPPPTESRPRNHAAKCRTNVSDHEHRQEVTSSRPYQTSHREPARRPNIERRWRATNSSRNILAWRAYTWIEYTAHGLYLYFQPSWNWSLFKVTGSQYTTQYKNWSGDEIANVNFYAVRPEATRIRWNNAK